MIRAKIGRLGWVVPLIFLFVLPIHAAEPLSGRWRLVSQKVGGEKTAIEQLMLRVIPSTQGLEFAYSVPVKDIQFVSLRFSARLDGSESDVTNGKGQKLGTAKVTKSGASEYTIELQGHDRPTASGKMTVSADGKTLKSESESKGRGGVLRTIQVFSRQ